MRANLLSNASFRVGLRLGLLRRLPLYRLLHMTLTLNIFVTGGVGVWARCDVVLLTTKPGGEQVLQLRVTVPYEAAPCFALAGVDNFLCVGAHVERSVGCFRKWTSMLAMRVDR